MAESRVRGTARSAPQSSSPSGSAARNSAGVSVQTPSSPHQWNATRLPKPTLRTRAANESSWNVPCIVRDTTFFA